MSTTFQISGSVVSASHAQPAPASQITYTVRYNDQQGRAVTREGVVPAFNRWPDVVDTVPAVEGDEIDGYGIVVGQRTYLYIHIPELPKIAPCPGQNARGGGDDDRRKRFLPGTNPLGLPGDDDGGGGSGLPGVPPPTSGGGFGDQGTANR